MAVIAARRFGLLFAAALATLPLSSCVTAPKADAPAKTPNAPAINHLYVVLDAETYAAVRDSRALAKILGRTDGGLPDYAPPAPDADRVFFRGRTTYLEFFAPNNRFGEPVGKVGLALGHDDPQRFDALEQKWRASCGDKARRTPVEWRRSDPPVPWYDALQCDDTAAGPDLALWAMVYRPEFYRWQSGDSVDGPTRTARADILAPRRAKGQGRFDITDVTIALADPLYTKLIAQLEQAGFAREDAATGTFLRGNGWTMQLRRVTTGPGLVSIQLETDRARPGTMQLGKLRAMQRANDTLSLVFVTHSHD